MNPLESWSPLKNLICLCTCAVVSCTGAEWKPPANPDPRKISREADADHRAKRYETALAKHVWYHHNALKIRPSLTGVRLSFALSAWVKLGQDYPPAMEKLREVRDEAAERVTSGEDVWQSFADLQSISDYLKEPEYTRDVFRFLDQTDRSSAQRVYHVAESALIRAKAYKLCGPYLQPQKVLARTVDNYHRNLDWAHKANDPKSGRAYARERITYKAGSLIALLVVNQRSKEAKEMAAAFKKEWNDPKFHAALDQAAAGKFPAPWP